MPKISVIIPVYNGEEYLIECLDSVVNQTLKEIEIICVDDGSTDKSLEILNEYRMKDSRIKILTQENSGAGVARNNAIQIANGEYVAFLDSDDLYPNIDTLSQLYKQALIHKVKICGGSANILTKKGILKNTIENYQFLKDEIMQYKDYQYDYGYWRFIYDRKFLIENNIAFPNYLRGQDPPFFIKAMTLAQEFYAMKMPTYIYRMSHKGILWTEKKAVDILCSYRDCLGIAKQYQLDNLYNRVIDRINRPYIKNAIIKYIDKPTLTNVIKEITRIEPERLDSIYYFEYKCNISIIISVYNVERYLRECLDSIVNQTLQDIEIICVDDGSTDKSSEILKEFAAKDSRIRVISQENQGLACSRNNAMKIAKGKYILFVDSDDYIRKDTLEMLYNYAEVNNLEMLSFGGTNFDNETRIDLGNPYYEFRYLPENFNIKCFNYKDCTDFITSMAVSSCLTMYKNLFIIHNNILFPSHLCFEDNVFFCKALMNANRCGILKDVLYFRRVHDQSITQNFEKHYLDYIKISDIVLSYLNEMKISEKIYKQYKNAYITKCISLYNKYSEKSQKLYYKELKKLVKKYDKKLLKLIKKPLSITQKVFSITNKPSDNGKWHKVITILGIKFSFRNKKKERKMLAKIERDNLKSAIANLQEQNEKLQHIIEQQNNELQSQITSQLQKIDTLKCNMNADKQALLKKIYKYCPEEKYSVAIADCFFEKTGEPLHLDNPQTFNEKIQWLKLYDSTPLKTQLADKYLVRDWVKEKIGEEYLIPLLGVWDNFDEIDFDKLPEQFVLKCNHGCGYNIIVKDKSKLDIQDARKKINQWMSEDFAFKAGFEMHYSAIPRKIIAEKYLENSSNDLYDYKFWCFNGKADYVQFLSERNTNGLKMAFYSKQWEKQNFVYSYPLDKKDIKKPDNLDKMFECAEKLAEGFPHVRVDLYRMDDGRIYFGEMTFTSASGFCKWSDEKVNINLGKQIKLPELCDTCKNI